jgi:hypothetical protein
VFGNSTDLLYAPYAPNTSYVLEAHMSVTNSRFGEWTRTESGYFDEATGVAGHTVHPGWVNCP